MRKASTSLVEEHFSQQIEYLNKRGITLRDVDRLKIEFCGATKLNELGIEWAGVEKGILWHIRDAQGDLTGAVGARVWYVQGFVEIDRPKFVTPKGQIPRLYHSPLADWSKLEAGSTVVLCESFLKADIVSMCGFYGIGVSGVWGWSHQKSLISDFARIPWKELRLKLVVCFDSNVGPDGKDLLNLATERFAAEMERLGVGPTIAYLPKPEAGGDWGLDDFCAARGAEAVRELIAGAEPIHTGLGQHMLVMNREVAVVQQLSRIVDLDTGALMTREQFVRVRFAHRKAWTEDNKPLSVASSWLEWADRNEVSDIVYKPGAGTIVEEGRVRSYNTWKGMGLDPVRNDELVRLWTEWLELAFPVVEERDWFCCWWASQLQTLGLKLTTGLVLVGVSGVGKGWVAEIMKRVFGMPNVAVCDLSVLSGKFNADFAMKQLVIVEEAEERSSDADKIYGRVKDIITNSHLRVERKGVDAFVVENCANIMLQGNKVDMIKLDEYDRRLGILEVENRKLPDGELLANNDKFWEPRWADMDAMAAAVYEWLLRYDLSDFNPKGKPPVSAAKLAMVESAHSPRELWVMELRKNPEEVMVVNGEVVDGPVATAKELEYVYQNGDVPMWEIDKRMSDAMNKALKLARFPMANAGNKIKWNGIPNRYFLLDSQFKSDRWTDVVSRRKFWSKIYTNKSKI
jgi:hypothetical protein